MLAMKIMDSFGTGGSFTEYYAIDFIDEVVLMGHDGPGHAGIAEGKTKVRPLQVYHGKIGRGLSVEMSVKTGPVTLLSIAESEEIMDSSCCLLRDKRWRGQSCRSETPIAATVFRSVPATFVNRWNAQAPAHHCAVGLGHIGSKLEKLALLLGLEVTTYLLKQVPFGQIFNKHVWAKNHVAVERLTHISREGRAWR